MDGQVKSWAVSGASQEPRPRCEGTREAGRHDQGGPGGEVASNREVGGLEEAKPGGEVIGAKEVGGLVEAKPGVVSGREEAGPRIASAGEELSQAGGELSQAGDGRKEGSEVSLANVGNKLESFTVEREDSVKKS